ncbi:hypothetical protein AJ79_02585 [Helicocarpus griseus UAMH5409]|uniref:THH1/TOM1/TOM3 domain-containing protein n=1 Tax=Helicocarpus griseus UAMH5409 TaxID=1447875 RepID=A0A2B7Y1R3_9EURO|nr:hypothetical protein AJ79_02585 [Helicocarpus griseus UAMH5409]
MAPRRGGGGGRGGSSSPSKCSLNNAFSSPYDKITIAFFAVFLVIDFLLLMVAWSKLVNQKRGRPAARWGLLISVFLMVFIHAWDIVFITLNECAVTDYDLYPKVQLVSVYLELFAIASLVGVVAVWICKRLHQAANMSPKLIAIFHGLWVAAFAGFYFIAVCIYAAVIAFQTSSSSSSRTRRRLAARLSKAWNGVMILAAVILLLGMISTVFNLLISRSRCAALKSSSLRKHIPLLAICSFCFGVVVLIRQVFSYRVRWSGPMDDNWINGYFAMQFLQMFFYSTTFLFALLAAASPALLDWDKVPAAHIPVQQTPSYAFSSTQPNQSQQHVQAPLIQPSPQSSPQQTYPAVPTPQPYSHYPTYEPYSNQTPAPPQQHQNPPYH